MTEVIIEEQGKGFPDIGEIVYDGQDNTLYRVESIDSGVFANQWKNNYIHATVSDAGDPTDMDDETFNGLRPVKIEGEV